MTSPTYGIGLGNHRNDEDERLAGSDALFDTATAQYLDALGIAPGLRCLEVGGGSGSVARFMADRVGVAGSVVVTDIATERLRGCDLPNVEVRDHDIANEPLEEGQFDIVHTRLVLRHLPDPRAALAKLVAALRPGGWLLVEDLDLTSWLHLPAVHLLCEPPALAVPLQACITAIAEADAAAGHDGAFVRNLSVRLGTLGFDDVGAEWRSPLVVGGSPGSAFATDSYRQLAPLLVDRGALSFAELDEMVAALEQPTAKHASLTMVSVWGRRS